MSEIPAPILPGRMCRPNDPCPCGSGRKFKRCHWHGWMDAKLQKIRELEDPRWWYFLRDLLRLAWWKLTGRL